MLVCDLHYENDWNLRRRYARKCGEINRNTRPCDGTFACVCKHSDKEFYRVSKALPVVPLDYKGLNSTLYDTYLIKTKQEQIEDEEEGWSILNIAIVLGSIIVGSILLCCIAY